MPTVPDPDTPQSVKAYRRLRDDIVTCRLAPGTRVTEKMLAAQMDLGVSPIREALTRLDHDGLINTLPRVGYQVAPLTLKLIDDMFVMWRIVAPELVRLGVSNSSQTQLDEMRANLADLAASTSTVDPDRNLRMVKAADRVFRSLAEATGNPFMLSICERIMGEMARVYVFILDNDPSVVLPQFSTDVTQLILYSSPGIAADAVARTIDATHAAVLRLVTSGRSVMQTELSFP